MTKQRNSEAEGPRTLASGERGGLSVRIRNLILGFKVEERRKRDGGDDAGASENRRRGDDTNVVSEKAN